MQVRRSEVCTLATEKKYSLSSVLTKSNLQATRAEAVAQEREGAKILVAIGNRTGNH